MITKNVFHLVPSSCAMCMTGMLLRSRACLCRAVASPDLSITIQDWALEMPKIRKWRKGLSYCTCTVPASLAHLFRCVGVSWRHLIDEQERIFNILM
ncbi:hypothetical protein JTE90_010348 [Oedothorax gibbosus]|uniref:Secreted protein n=1 Tax=Oedothorax gibbosus TaxID=931172 RepID=A0AAV6U048_9ARAC|nr:hypothetical protein JTE90_010348 [Oedothorax gibbosus]